MQSVFAVARDEGTLERATMISAVQEQERTKVVQTKPPTSHLVLSPFVTGLDTFEQMVLSSVTAKHFRCLHGQGGARMTILSLPLS